MVDRRRRSHRSHARDPGARAPRSTRSSRWCGEPIAGIARSGPGVIDAFYYGLQHVDLDQYDYVCQVRLRPRVRAALLRAHGRALRGRSAGSARLGQAAPPDGRQAGSASGRGTRTRSAPVKFYRVPCFSGHRRLRARGLLGRHRRAPLPHEGLGRELRRRSRASASSTSARWARATSTSGTAASAGAAVSTSWARRRTTSRRSRLYRMAEAPYVLGGLGIPVGYVQANMKRLAAHGRARVPSSTCGASSATRFCSVSRAPAERYH